MRRQCTSELQIKVSSTVKFCNYLFEEANLLSSEVQSPNSFAVQSTKNVLSKYELSSRAKHDDNGTHPSFTKPYRRPEQRPSAPCPPSFSSPPLYPAAAPRLRAAVGKRQRLVEPQRLRLRLVVALRCLWSRFVALQRQMLRPIERQRRCL